MEKAPQDLELILKHFPSLLTMQVEKLKLLDALYRDWNSKINVISRQDIDGLYEKHVLHSLSIARFTSFRTGAEVIDIGTGGGFPGIPLAIIFPDVQFHLVDSIGKKLKVVDEIAGAINLDNVTTQHTRAEQVSNRKFDFAVSRAVAPLKDLWQWSRPLLKRKSNDTDAASSANGIPFLTPGLICLKGGDLALEIAESKTKPVVTAIFDMFRQEYFRDKQILYIKTP